MNEGKTDELFTHRCLYLFNGFKRMSQKDGMRLRLVQVFLLKVILFKVISMFAAKVIVQSFIQFGVYKSYYHQQVGYEVLRR